MTETEPFHWQIINGREPTQQALLRSQYHITEEVITYALDEDESPHAELDRATGTFLLIYNVPRDQPADDVYDAPLTFIIKGMTLLVVDNGATLRVSDKLYRTLSNADTASPFSALFRCLVQLTDMFGPLVQTVDNERKAIVPVLREHTTRKGLLRLSDLSLRADYLSRSAKQNTLVLRQVHAHPIYHKFTIGEEEQLADVVIEADQVLEMAELSSHTLDHLTQTYDSVLNNNLNDIMKFMTVWSLLLTVPTIVTGFYGMNVALPAQHSPWGWVITLGITAVLWLIMGAVLHRWLK
ncbi:magnesium transporter CorA family protein [Schleiferilactobacillus shenzhenensis]|uniref:CorA n=1 Tax=Schleiferilactobacillus shenzhenensis LY-73 TaxID=1231336 RepID=U4TPR7_9LACO|nr:magnesium transporter CorA family protein [Schleiferilactobacillus shenzhenensis]ERL63873.1 hypothetical protein L248_1814 [Schleiferilactobacillus shenzhenensis LY-73]